MTRRRSAIYLPVALLCAGNLIGFAVVSGKAAPASVVKKEFPKPDVDGTVMKPDGTPAAGAMVTWGTGKEDKLPPLTAVTDDKGQFHFDGKTAWSREESSGTVFAQADGFGITGVRIQYTSDKDFSHTQPLTIALVPAAEARLRFLGPDGKPAAGVMTHVQAFFKNADFIPAPSNLAATSAVSAADGTAVIKNLPLGYETAFVVDNPQFAQLRYPEGQFILTADSGTQWKDIKLQAGGSIDGVMTAPDGRPVAKARVTAQTADSMPKYANTTTDDKGHFSLTQMLPGKYKLSAYLMDPWAATWAARDLPVTLASGEHKSGVKLGILKGAIVKGRILYKNGVKSTGGVNVSVERHTGATVDSAMSVYVEAPGDFHFTLAPGDIKVSVFEGGNSLAQQEFTAKSGETKVVSFTVDAPAPPASVRGIVTDQNGKPVPGATVTFSTASFEPSSTVTSGPDGTFSLSAENSPMIYVRARKGDSVTLKDTPAVDGDNVTLKLQDNALATITGKVVDTNGQPIAGATVTPIEWHARSGDNLDAVTTDASGLYHTGMLPPGFRYSFSTNAKGYASIFTDSLFPQPGETLNAADIVLKRKDSFVAGRVIDSHGFPLARAEVTPNDDRDTHVTTDKQGKFRIDGVAPGDITLEVKKGDEWTNMQVKAGKDDNLIKTYSQAAQQKDQDTRPKPVDYVGKYAPEFNVEKWVNVSPVSMSDLKGKIIVFDMWGCCADQLYETQELAQSLASRGVVAIGLNVSGSKLEDVQAHITQEKLTMPIAIDKDTARALGGGGFEYYSIVGRDGKIAYAGWDSNQMMVVLGKLLAADKSK